MDIGEMIHKTNKQLVSQAALPRAPGPGDPNHRRQLIGLLPIDLERVQRLRVFTRTFNGRQHLSDGRGILKMRRRHRASGS